MPRLARLLHSSQILRHDKHVSKDGNSTDWQDGRLYWDIDEDNIAYKSALIDSFQLDQTI